LNYVKYLIYILHGASKTTQLFIGVPAQYIYARSALYTVVPVRLPAPISYNRYYNRTVEAKDNKQS